MKQRLLLPLLCSCAVLLALPILVLGPGCASAPTAFESKFFDIETNLVARVVVATNVAPSYRTNVVVVWETNHVSGSEVLVVPVTNTTVAVSYQTNRAVVTNFEEEVLFTPNENAERVSEVAGHAAGLFGPVGEMVGILTGAFFGFWGWFRSQRAAKTAGVLAQVIETGREILQSTPQGRALDSEWKSWMIQHQAEHGVILEVIRLIESAVDTPTAKETARKLLELMQAPKVEG